MRLRKSASFSQTARRSGLSSPRAHRGEQVVAREGVATEASIRLEVDRERWPIPCSFGCHLSI
jgi:hypothetical protein